MQTLIDLLKSRGKLGASILVLIGIAEFVAVSLGYLSTEQLVGASTLVGLGLSLYGIRAKLP